MSPDLDVQLDGDRVASVEFCRPPHNHFDVGLIREIADAYETLDRDPACRAIVLCSRGRHFCAGADFVSAEDAGERDTSDPGGGGAAGAEARRMLYGQAARLFEAQTPVVAAVQGAAIGGGLGLALSADFRVASPSSRFAANFARLGIHHGFGLTVTLPAVVGGQAALELLYTGRRVGGEEARSLGLCDRLAAEGELRETGRALAAEIAASAPLAVRAIRRTMRGGLADQVRAATSRESAEQAPLFESEDFREGVAASAARRAPDFRGR